MIRKFQISNFKFQIPNTEGSLLDIRHSCQRQGWFTTTNASSCGFTIIELLVTMSVITIVGVIIGGILVATLRGSMKASVVSDVKQNGDYAISQISSTIRSASNLNILPCGSPSAPVQTVTVTQLDNSQTIFDCSGTTINANGNSLLDTSKVSLVPSSCSLTCTQQTASDVPVVQIKFTLTEKNGGSFVEQQSTIPFQTSVSLRNIQE